MAKEQIKLYDKFPGENAKRYSSFCEYRNLLPQERSLSKVAKKTASAQTPVKIRSRLTQLKHWSSEDKWQARCEAWDADQEQAFRDNLSEKQKKMSERQANIALTVIGKAVDRLKQINAALNPEEISVAEAIRLLEMGTRMERHALGVPDTVIRRTETDNGGSGRAESDDRDVDMLVNDPIAAELMQKLAERERQLMGRS